VKRRLHIISGSGVYIRPVLCEFPNDLGAITQRSIMDRLRARLTYGVYARAVRQSSATIVRMEAGYQRPALRSIQNPALHYAAAFPECT